MFFFSPVKNTARNVHRDKTHTTHTKKKGMFCLPPEESNESTPVWYSSSAYNIRTCIAYARHQHDDERFLFPCSKPNLPSTSPVKHLKKKAKKRQGGVPEPCFTQPSIVCASKIEEKKRLGALYLLSLVSFPTFQSPLYRRLCHRELFFPSPSTFVTPRRNTTKKRTHGAEGGRSMR